MSQKLYDVIIIGGGPAGLTAALYAARRAMRTLVISKDIGGQASKASKIENYPGFTEIYGWELMQKFLEQAMKSGAEFLTGEVLTIRENADQTFDIEANIGGSLTHYKAKAIIVASGKVPRKLNVPGEDKFLGRGVSYCATCDAPLYRGRVTAVIGGGNSAFDAALILSDIASKVYLIHRREEFRAFEYLVEKVKNRPNVEFILNSVVTEIKGDSKVHSIVVKNVKTDRVKELKVDGVFVEIGAEVSVNFLKELVKLDDLNQVIINANCETYYPDRSEIRPGIFAAGDVTNTPFKQIVVAAGEGCKAALQAYNYIHKRKVRVTIDWKHPS